MNFEELGICQEVLELLKKNGIKEPTMVQERSIPILRQGKDLIAQAQTGTGKTLAFILPMIEKINFKKDYIQALIVTPTRELAKQITDEAQKYMKDASILLICGGQDIEQQITKIKNGIHIVVGTPGRLVDHIKRKTIDLEKVNILVLDEADLMLDMGFLSEVRDIINHVPKKRQTMLFSATISKGVKILAKKFLNEAERVTIKPKEVMLENIKQIMVRTSEEEKLNALCDALDKMNPFMSMVFCKTRENVIFLNDELGKLGYQCDELRGDMTQRKRERVMKIFKKADLPILISTDIAARGLDIEGVTHVFSYDVPQNVDSYIHRIGRTGRKGQDGVAVTFVTAREEEKFLSIENSIIGDIEKRQYGNIDIESNFFGRRGRKNNRNLGGKHVAKRSKYKRRNANSETSTKNFRYGNRKG
ncbi:MAG: DEAD/DEAH box helicase [Clostridiales bacterium]|nr:DEAD/DEAH box helicase [Clostridiales bacterium]